MMTEHAFGDRASLPHPVADADRHPTWARTTGCAKGEKLTGADVAIQASAVLLL